MNILQCHSRGDKRFSALYAKLADGRTIEQVYQGAKRDSNGRPYAKGTAKGKAPAYLQILGKRYKCSNALRHTFYTMLWWIYFIENPDLIEEAARHDAFVDIFDGHGGIGYLKECSFLPEEIEDGACQARAIGFIVGGEAMFLPHILRDAMEAYWKRNHGELLWKICNS